MKSTTVKGAAIESRVGIILALAVSGAAVLGAVAGGEAAEAVFAESATWTDGGPAWAWWLRIGFRVALTGLLVALSVVDVRTKRVPHPIGWPLLAASVGVRAWLGSWALPVLVIGLVLADLAPPKLRFPLVAVLVGGALVWAWLSNDGVMWFLALWYGLVYLLWLLKVTGGGDVRLVMTLLALYPDARMAWALWIGWLLVALAWYVRLYGRYGPLLAEQGVKGVLQRPLPDRKELEQRGRPTIPGLALGAIAYLLWTF